MEHLLQTSGGVLQVVEALQGDEHFSRVEVEVAAAMAAGVLAEQGAEVGSRGQPHPLPLHLPYSLRHSHPAIP